MKPFPAPPPPPANAELEKWMASKDPAQQLLADETFAAMGTENTVAFFVDRFERRKRVRLRGRKIILLQGVLFVLFFPSLLFVAVMAQHVRYVPASAFVSLNSTFYLMLLYFPALLSFAPLVTPAVIARMSRLNDKRFLPMFVSGLKSSDRTIFETAKQGLLNLLPRLTPADRHLLTEKEWKFLVRCLSMASRRGRPTLTWYNYRLTRFDPDFARAILHALGNVGIGNALPTVQRIATYSDAPELRQTAGNYLTTLTAAEPAAATLKQGIR